MFVDDVKGCLLKPGSPSYPPKLSDTGTWVVWDTETGAYTDTGVKAFYGDNMPATGVEDAGKVLTVTEAGVPGWMLPSKDDWEKLVDVTTEEDASRLTFQFDDVEEIICIVSAKSTSKRLNFTISNTTSTYHYEFLQANSVSSNVLWVGKRIGGMRYVCAGWPVSETPDSAQKYALLTYSTQKGMLIYSSSNILNSIYFSLNTADDFLYAGARIQIFGR